MSPALAEAQRALYGTWRLFLGDANGLLFLGRSVAAFWRSYWATVICLIPAFLTSALFAPSEETVVADGMRGALAFILGVAAWPFVTYVVARLGDVQDRALTYLIAYNWAPVLIYTAGLPLAILATSGDTGGLGALLIYGLYLASMIFAWQVARLALGLPRDVAAAMVAVDILLGRLLYRLVGLFA